MSATSRLQQLCKTFKSNPSYSNRRSLSQFIDNNVVELFIEDQHWIVNVLQDPALPISVLRNLPSLTLQVIFTHNFSPPATLIASLQRKIFDPNFADTSEVIKSHLELISTLLSRNTVTIPMIYNAIWSTIKINSSKDTLPTLPTLDQTPQPLTSTDFLPQFECFRYYLSRYFTVNSSFEGSGQLLEVVQKSFAFATSNQPQQQSAMSDSPPLHPSSQPIPPFSIESCFQHALMNSFEEHQYYQQNPQSTSTTNHPKVPPPPHILFPDYTSIPHPYFTIHPNAMSDPEFVKTTEYQVYFIGMFIFAHPLESFINTRLQTGCESGVMKTPILAIRPFISARLFTQSIAFIYQCYLLNFRFHLIDSVAAKKKTDTQPPQVKFFNSRTSSAIECDMLDPLFYWKLAHPDRPESNQSQHLSSNNSNPQYLLQPTPPSKISIHSRHSLHTGPDKSILNYLSKLVLNQHAATPSNTSSSTQMDRPKNHAHVQPATSFETSLNSAVNTADPLTTFNTFNPFLNSTIDFSNTSELFNNLVLNIIGNADASSSRSMWCVGYNSIGHFDSCKTPFTTTYLHALIQHSYRQFQTNTPTLYQQLFTKMITNCTTCCVCFPTFIILAPLFAFQNDNGEMTTFDFQLVQKHIILLTHAGFLNPSVQVPGSEYCEDELENIHCHNRVHRALIPVRAALFTWLMIHSGCSQIFPTPPPNASQGNLFYHAITAVKKVCACAHGDRDYLDTKNNFLQLLNHPTLRTINARIENPLTTAANANLMCDIEKLVIDNQGNIIYVQLCQDQSTFPTAMSENDLDEYQEVWDTGITVLDFSSPFFHTPLEDYISKHTSVLGNVLFGQKPQVPVEFLDFEKWRDVLKKLGDERFDNWYSDDLADKVDALLTDTMLYDIIMEREFDIPEGFEGGLHAYLDAYPLRCKVEMDCAIAHEFTESQSNAISSTSNQQLLKTPQIITLQRQYKAYLKELLEYETSFVSNILKSVVLKAHDAGLFQADHDASLFKCYPFPSPSTVLPSPTRDSEQTPASLQVPDQTNSQTPPSPLQLWCIEMLLVASLNIQPTLNPTIHTHLYLPQSSTSLGHPIDQQVNRPIWAGIASWFIQPERIWLATLPHVEPIRHERNLADFDSPRFMFDSLLQLITEIVLKTHSILFSLCEEESK